MSDFGIGAIVGGGLGFLGQLEMADAQEKATQANIGINWDNIRARQKEIAEARAYAEKIRGEGKLGTTDLRGTTTKFVPGKGWVVTGSPALLAMMKAQDAEQMQQLTHDLPQRRNIMDRNFKRSFEDDALADTFRRQLINTAPARSDEAYTNDLYTAMTTGLKEADRISGSRAYNQAQRTNNSSNIPKIFEAQQRANNASYAQAALQAKLQARGQGIREQTERKNQLSNLYNMFATRAAQLPDVGYRPQPIDTNSNIALAASQNNAANQIGAQTMQMQGIRQDYVPANFGYGNAIGGLGASLGSGITAMGAKKAYDQGTGGGATVAGFGGGGGGGGSGYRSSGYYSENENS